MLTTVVLFRQQIYKEVCMHRVIIVVMLLLVAVMPF
jgi:hypothetical protein